MLTVHVLFSHIVPELFHVGFMASLNIGWSWFHAAFLHQADQHSGNPGAAKGGRFGNWESSAFRIAMTPLNLDVIRWLLLMRRLVDLLMTHTLWWHFYAKNMYTIHVCLCKLYFSRLFLNKFAALPAKKWSSGGMRRWRRFSQPHRMLVVFHLNSI